MEYNMIFVMRYDLLHSNLDYWNLPCDVAFDVCREVYDGFLASEEYQWDMSEYEALQIYINNNRWHIDNVIEETGRFLSEGE